MLDYLRTSLASIRTSIRAPAELRRNHRTLSESARSELYRSLERNFFSDPVYYPDPPDTYLRTPAGARDMNVHLTGQVERVRTSVVPWVASVLPLHGARILEVGCGTGASSLAFLEQGARLTGIDVNPAALQVARDRCRLYGLEASYVQANGAELSLVARPGEFDAIVFFAVLEHMTPQERLASLRQAWRLLRPGKFLIVVELPNRLWHTDVHTSGEPFFFWLPDDVAFAYSRYARRAVFNQAFRENGDKAMVRFYRWGRGVSYHDFVLALDIPAEELPVVDSMWLFIRRQRGIERLNRLTRAGRYERFLRSLAPRIHPGFMCCGLDLIFRKT